MTSDWPDTSFAGTEAARRARSARTTVDERMRWLEDVLREAERSGALARVRARKQAEVMATWNSDLAGGAPVVLDIALGRRRPRLPSDGQPS